MIQKKKKPRDSATTDWLKECRRKAAEALEAEVKKKEKKDAQDSNQHR